MSSRLTGTAALSCWLILSGASPGGVGDVSPSAPGAAGSDKATWLRLDVGGEDAPVGGPISSGTRFYFRLAGWYTFLDATLAYGDPVNGAPVDLDLESTLDYDTDLATLRGQFGFRFGDRFGLDFGVSGPFNYDGQTTRTISFADASYDANASTELDMVGLDADFSYDVVKEDRFRFWLGAGVRAVGLHFEVEGTATDENGNPIGTRRDDLDAGAAVPVVGLGLRWDISRNFYLSAKAMGLYVGDLGNAADASAEFGWDFTRNFGLFAGYRFTRFEAEVETDDFDFEIEATVHGPYAGMEARF